MAVLDRLGAVQRDPTASVAPTEDGKSAVRFAHEGTMVLADITHHTLEINREVRSLGGEYDGWETSVEQAG